LPKVSREGSQKLGGMLSFSKRTSVIVLIGNRIYLVTLQAHSSLRLVSFVPSSLYLHLNSQSYRVVIPLLFISFTYISHAIPRWVLPSSTLFALIGKLVAFSYASIVDGYYLFDPYWASKDWNFDRRVEL
jgi:hypothetical protein